MNKLVKKKVENKRHRSTNLELLGGVPIEALRRIRETAAKADLPLERVFRDVLAIGVSVVTDPNESPYTSLIAFRTGLSQKQAELETDAITPLSDQRSTQGETLPDAGLRSPDPYPGDGTVGQEFESLDQDGLQEGQRNPEGLDHAPLQRGLGTEDQESDPVFAGET